MKLRIACVIVGFSSLVLSLVPLNVAQTATQTASALPRLVRFGGTVKDLDGNPLTGVVGITFALYSARTGGAALWLESQNVTADSNGRYAVLLGSTKPDGLPADLFTSEQAHWVGVQVSGQAEQPRVLLVSAPYALKAGDAETIGGLPPSAFVLSTPPTIGSATASSPAGGGAESVSPATTSDVTTTGGTVDAIPLFFTATSIQNSLLTQTGTTAVNVGGKLNLPATAAATKTVGADSRPLDFVASSFSSSTSTPVNQTFQWQAEPAANDTSSPSGTLNLLYGLGATAPSETGLKLSSKGIFTFAAGQTFPGTGDGTVTSVATGLGLKGGPITKTGTLAIDTTVVPQLSTVNTFATNQTINGSLTVDNGASVGGSNGTEALFVLQLGTGSGMVSDVGGKGNGVVGNANVGNGIVGNATTGTGVVGNSTATSGKTTGVAGTNASSAGYGVEGTSPNVGVFGNGTGSGGIGLDGHGTFIGAKGISSGSSGVTRGIYGQNSSPSGYGVEGTSGNVGVYGTSAGASATGAGHGNAGVWGDSGGAANSGYAGVLGTADGNSAGWFLNNGTSSTVVARNSGNGPAGAFFSDSLNSESPDGYGATLFVEQNNLGSSNQPSFVLWASAGAMLDGGIFCEMDTTANWNCNDGTATVTVRSGTRRVALNSVQSTEHWFEDAGSGQLSNGSARVELDPIFAGTVNTGIEYHVFLTPKGDCKGLYVTNETTTAFEVHELGGGTSGIAFDYRIMAKRVGYEKVRLKDLTERLNKAMAANKMMRRPVRPSAAPQP